MAHLSAADTNPAIPHIRQIGPQDLRAALRDGVEDFRKLPSHAVFLCLFYPVAGLLLGGFLFRYDVIPLVFPLVAGFALIGPFAAVGLYELSRRLELGLDSSWEHAFDVLRSPAKWSIFALGVLLMAIFIAWLMVAQSIYAHTLGALGPASIAGFVRDLFTTAAGWKMIILGNLVGFLFAVAAMSVSVISFPLLLDRHVGAAVAILTSVRAVLDNPGPMAAWGLIVVACLVAGSIPFLLGLAVVMPVLGHATWHLYRRVVAQ
jgi:uncharacterized membrane protein